MSGIDLNKIKSRLNKLQNTQKGKDRLWKPPFGKTQVRLVPYKFNKENPFIELYFHYNINNKSYLSPMSYGRPDPIVEFAEKLKRMGDKEDWKAARKMEPKLRTFVPVIVRGEEEEGVRFWGFGKTVYQELLGYIADPDYGDITHPLTGRDITVEYTSPEDSGTSYPLTTIRVKPKETPLSDDKEKMKLWIDSQSNINEIYQELSYDELKKILEGWLNPSDDEEEAEDSGEETKETETSATEEVLSAEKSEGKDEDESKGKKKLDDVASAFDELFDD